MDNTFLKNTLAVDVIDVDNISTNSLDCFLNVAKKINISKLILLTKRPNFTYDSLTVNNNPIYFKKNSSELIINGIILKKGLLINNVNNLQLKTFDYFFANSERQFFESKVDFIINSEKFFEKDSVHFRKTALNQVHANLCKKNHITIAITISKNFNSRHLGKILQNIKLIRKYSLESNFFSLATNPYDLLPLEFKKSLIISTNLNNKKKLNELIL